MLSNQSLQEIWQPVSQRDLSDDVLSYSPNWLNLLPEYTVAQFVTYNFLFLYKRLTLFSVVQEKTIFKIPKNQSPAQTESGHMNNKILSPITTYNK